MTVSELIAELQKLPADADVWIDNEYGSGHAAATRVAQEGSLVMICFSDYDLTYPEYE